MEHEQEDVAEKINTLVQDLKARRHEAAKILQKHFSLSPDGIIVFSIVDGKIQGDVTPFGSTGALLFAERLIKKYVNESFENSLIAQATPPTIKETVETPLAQN